MRDSTAMFRDALVVDIEHGTVLNAPAETTVSERWVNSHPFVQYTPTHIIVGPDSAAVAGGSGGLDYKLYEIVGGDLGDQMNIRRES